jgi:hypothetical protein
MRGSLHGASLGPRYTSVVSPRWRLRLLVRASGLLLIACSEASPLVPTSAEPLVFIASAADFDGFRSWRSFAITIDIAPGDSHINGPRHVFYNRVPPKGATKFPVGTILVKETDPGPVTQRTVFAMVKRGGDYDPTGDVNWEWFQLLNNADGTESIVWRGAGPAGGVYGNGPLGGCDACHAAAERTDYVMTPGLEAMLSVPPG